MARGAVPVVVAAALALTPGLLAASLTASPVAAQSVPGDFDLPADEQMLLTADELIYNNVTERVIASGGVQIDYGGYNLVARQVEYNQVTGRMRAVGDVQIVEPDGNVIYADEIDITDDFADGFVTALKIETPDNTRIAAESADRRGGVVTTFNHGVYTACEACEKNPEKPPFWQVKAEKVVRDERTKTIRLRNARFELFGLPIAYLPYFEVPDFDRKRKSGFLTPSIGSDDDLGYFLTVPYFLTLGPSADLTVWGTGYTKQGFLLDSEYRQQFDNGIIRLRMAGISQQQPEDLYSDSGTATVDSEKTERGLVGTTGQFNLNSRWTFGWKAMLESDPAFARTYGIEGFDETHHVSEVYLTGLGERNYFDLYAFKVDVRSSTIRSSGQYLADYLEDREGRVHPLLDYNKIFSQPVLGGELSLDVNGQAISRDTEYEVDGIYRGLQGQNQRVTAELEWKRTLTTNFGLRVSPLLAARADGHHFDTSSMPGTLHYDDSAWRGMVTAGLEVNYPLLVTTASSTHVFEPIAQVFLRPNESYAGELPNEDAQSFVFDAATLFERDKFSGYDRIEGGSRANVGMRYTGSFANGVTARALFGQSYHLGGVNSFTVDSLTFAGRNSGLDQDVSDYVGLAGIELPVGVGLTASARLDKDTFDMARGDLTATFTNEALTGRITYSDIKAQRATGTAGYGSEEDRRGVSGALNLRFHENWSVFGSSGYDLVEKRFNTSMAGFSFENECVIVTVSYTHRPSYTDNPNEWSLGARLSFRTLGDLDFGNSTGKTF
ncbi:LPS-assembly protein LptD [Pseudohoeflea coraliihabitans]|uniref:LPS-assembly protein LptD n=1 Tax=Pseudohoeflea coraliihabitans TaxID=2860393 RepID=A0ABS6WTG6_9HYPH|nr:LPS-assembly protein LptD [Pseudohoeflea sp. DP4N28-3]